MVKVSRGTRVQDAFSRRPELDPTDSESFFRARASCYRSPTKRLKAAMVVLTLRDLNRGSRLQRLDAIEWINTYSSHPLSFENCCRDCGIDPDAAREILNEMYMPGDAKG